MSDPAGRLNIQLERTPRGLRCRIQSTRPVKASAIFVGRSAAQTATLLPMLYSICAKAQASACACALESAIALAPPAPVQQMRLGLVAIETLREHLWRLLLDWPRFLDAPPDQASTALLLARVKRLFSLFDPEGNLFHPGAQTSAWDRPAILNDLDALDELIAQGVLGMPAEPWLAEVQDADSLNRWIQAGTTSAARLLGALCAAGEESLGQSEVQPLPDLSHTALRARLLAPDGESFISTPSWDKRPRETTPFTRQADQALIRALVARHGKGLLSRLAAQVFEVARLIVETRNGLERRATTPAVHHAHPGESGVGLGQVEAARGRLVHLARIEGDRILDYRILAPTEWNFHPEGVLAQALAGLPDAEDGHLARWAELLILATDPCVAFDLSIDRLDRDESFVS